MENKQLNNIFHPSRVELLSGELQKIISSEKIPFISSNANPDNFYGLAVQVFPTEIAKEFKINLATMNPASNPDQYESSGEFLKRTREGRITKTACKFAKLLFIELSDLFRNHGCTLTQLDLSIAIYLPKNKVYFLKPLTIYSVTLVDIKSDAIFNGQIAYQELENELKKSCPSVFDGWPGSAKT